MTIKTPLGMFDWQKARQWFHIELPKGRFTILRHTEAPNTVRIRLEQFDKRLEGGKVGNCINEVDVHTADLPRLAKHLRVLANQIDRDLDRTTIE